MNDDDREFVRDLFRPSDGPPADVVPGSGPTRDDYLQQNDAVGTFREVAVPGEPILDVDGIPIAMPTPTITNVYFGGAVVTVAELARVGLTPADVPNLTILNPRKPTS